MHLFCKEKFGIKRVNVLKQTYNNTPVTEKNHSIQRYLIQNTTAYYIFNHTAVASHHWNDVPLCQELIQHQTKTYSL